MASLDHPLLRYHGGKWRMAKKIIDEFPPHVTYVEPFGGAGSVLLQKTRSPVEIYNDIDGDIVNVFRVVRDNGDKLKELLEFTPYSREEWRLAYEESNDPIERARRTIVRAAMSFGSAGATKGSSGFRGKDKGTHYAKTWPNYVSSLLKFKERLAGVVIENLPALKIIEQYDSEDTLFYLDPPYLLDTRVLNGCKYYRYEMSDSQHIEILEVVRNIKGMAIISGYENTLYDKVLFDWRKVKFDVRANGRKGTVKRTEVIWISPKCEIKKGLFSLMVYDNSYGGYSCI